MEALDVTLVDKGHAGAGAFNDFAANRNKQSLNRRPFNICGRRCAENGFKRSGLLAVHDSILCIRQIIRNHILIAYEAPMSRRCGTSLSGYSIDNKKYSDIKTTSEHYRGAVFKVNLKAAAANFSRRVDMACKGVFATITRHGTSVAARVSVGAAVIVQKALECSRSDLVKHLRTFPGGEFIAQRFSRT